MWLKEASRNLGAAKGRWGLEGKGGLVGGVLAGVPNPPGRAGHQPHTKKSAASARLGGLA